MTIDEVRAWLETSYAWGERGVQDDSGGAGNEEAGNGD